MAKARTAPAAGVKAGAARPVVRAIGPADLKDALAKGFADFKAKPSHLIFLAIIYPIVGLGLGRLIAGYDILPLIWPLIAGYTLIGPVAAIGLYELSRRRELGLDIAWKHAFDPIRSPSIVSIVILSLVLLIIFIGWQASAQFIYAQIFGHVTPTSIVGFLEMVLTTAAGWRLIIVGSLVGFLFAVASLTLGVVSFPMLLDRDVGAFIAVQTSVRAVLANPMTMAMWGLIVAVALLLGTLPLFVGLAIVLPVLGHATWHLYRKVVV